MEKNYLEEFKGKPAFFLEFISKANKTLADILYKIVDLIMVSSLDEFNNNSYNLSKTLAATDAVMLTGYPKFAIETYDIIGYPNTPINVTLEEETPHYIV